MDLQIDMFSKAYGSGYPGVQQISHDESQRQAMMSVSNPGFQQSPPEDDLWDARDQPSKPAVQEPFETGEWPFNRVRCPRSFLSEQTHSGP